MVVGKRGAKQLASISSPHMPAVKPGCKVKFNYQMSGMKQGRLSVYLNMHGYKRRVWTMVGDQVSSTTVV